MSDEWLEQLFAHFIDESVDEVLVNRCDTITVSRAGVLSEGEALPSLTAEELTRMIQDWVHAQGKRLDPRFPANGGIYQSYRWHAVIAPVAVDGPLLSLRRHRLNPKEAPDFQWSDSKGAATLLAAMDGKGPIVIYGPTGSGKTTLLARLLSQRCFDERVAILEQVVEIPCLSRRWIRLVAQPPRIEDGLSCELPYLLAEALRLRPDRIVVGEIRSKEAWPFLQASLSGHRSCLATMHATNGSQARQRLISLAAAHTKNPERLVREIFDSLDATLVGVTRSAGEAPLVHIDPLC